jgi:purine nucleosidase/pyrimidine-specific ribonucleoside hydrolase
MAVPVLLDCDPGHDDAIAIMLAAGNPAIDLLGITTVAGNQTLPKTTLNARRVCTAAGITTVPIAAGRAQPLHHPAVVTTVETNVAIELAGPHTRGATVVDLHQVTERRPNAQVAVDLDTDRFWDLVIAAVATLG